MEREEKKEGLEARRNKLILHLDESGEVGRGHP